MSNTFNARLTIALALCATLACPIARADRAAVRMLWDVRVPMRDGASLAANVYLPAGVMAPPYCVLSRTPYIADSLHDRAMYFALHGVTFIAQDVRGRGNSDGVFGPFLQERLDGYDSVEWVAKQPWCSGRVVMWGGSYGAWTQWTAAAANPPHLVAIAPAASPAAGADMPGIGMIGTAYIAQWLAFTSGKTLQLQEYLDSARWGALLRAWTEEGTPFRTLDARIGFPSPLFQTWADHPDQDAYWSDYNPSEKDLRTLRAPSLTITGMYDEAQRGAMALYRARSAADPTAENWLVIGPWDHGGTRDPQTNVGGVDFGEAGRIDLNQLHLDYYGHAALGAPTPAFLRDRVAYYVTGAEKWRYAKTLDSVTAAQRPAYLGPNGSLTYALGSGSDRYVWDPRDTSAAKAEAEGDPSLLIDQPTPKPALVYETQPFEADTELSGFLKLTAWISIDQPDTDFDLSVRLLRTDGSTVRLSNALSRARYREGWARPQLIRTHEPLRYEISNFPFISRLVRKGERLQLVVGPSTSIWVEKNYNTGGRVADGTLSESRAVAVTLVHDAKHPSALYLPIAASDADSNSAAARMPQKPGP